ncbi:hypothetical protein GCM10007939_04230 [Amylibacter marinus]|uniref:Sulfotransferase domain-containing protein n=2 Tax=Amylibacter marinus TaxID=1475483 RepID=A0ABQ5VS29_9RHOB|nr:hypothetical protein GCM10007939_04230 [Amylibacter marinus]
MMQMLDAGGVQVLSDGVRRADQSNPKGYFEWEPIKKLVKDTTVIRAEIAAGRVVKVISTLLPRLPKKYDYKVLYMQRDIGEVIQSQQKMLTDTGQNIGAQDADISAKFQAHDAKVRAWLTRAPHMQELFVNHKDLLTDPERQVAKIVSFLGPEALPQRDRMAAVVDPRLYRTKIQKPVRGPLGLFAIKPPT